MGENNFTSCIHNLSIFSPQENHHSINRPKQRYQFWEIAWTLSLYGSTSYISRKVYEPTEQTKKNKHTGIEQPQQIKKKRKLFKKKKCT